MKKFFLFFFSFFVGIFLLIWVIKIVGWEEIKAVFLTFSGWKGMVILALTALAALIAIWRWKVILRSQGYDLPVTQLAWPYLAGYSVIFLFPMLVFGGELFKSYVLKEKNSVPFEKGIATVILDRILEFTTYLVIIFLGFCFFLLKIGLPPKNLVIILGIFFLFLGGGTILFYFKGLKKESIIKFFLKFFNRQLKPKRNTLLEIEKEIFKFLDPKKKAMWQVFGLSFLREAVHFTRCWVLILFLGKSISFLPALSILGFSYLAIMIPIPAALGSHEAIQTFAFGAFGLGKGAGLAFAMIIRGAEVIIVLIGIIFLSRLGIGLAQKTLFRKIENLTNNKNKTL